jgi:hypothetical protein
MKAEYRSRLPGMPEIAKQLRLARELLQNKIEIVSLKDLPFETLAREEFGAAFCHTDRAREWLRVFADARPDIRFGRYEGKPSLFLPPAGNDSFGQLAVLNRLAISNLMDKKDARLLIEQPLIRSTYGLVCDQVLIVNRRGQAVRLHPLAPKNPIIFTRFANWLPAPGEEARWTKLTRRFFASQLAGTVSLTEIHQPADVDSTLHELGHLWAANLNLDPDSEEEHLARNQAEDLQLAPESLEFALEIPAINAIQEMFYSERIASLIARIIRSRLAEAGFLDRRLKHSLEYYLQTYDLYRARFILENYPDDAADLFASRWARSKPGLEQAKQILRATTALEQSTLQRIQALGPHTERVDWRPEMNSIEYSWESPDQACRARIHFKPNQKFAEGIISADETKSGHQYCTGVAFGYMRGFQLLEWRDEEEPVIHCHVAAGLENPNFRENLTEIEKVIDAVLTELGERLPH